MPPFADDGLTQNPCWPSTVINDPGFALLTDDSWYNNQPTRAKYRAMYKRPPQAVYTAGKYQGPQFTKRDDWEGEFADEEFIDAAWNEGEEYLYLNETSGLDSEGASALDGEEFDTWMDLERCSTPDCSEEIAEYGDDAVVLDPDMVEQLGLDLEGFETDDAFDLPLMTTTTTAEAEVVIVSATAVSGAERSIPSVAGPTPSSDLHWSGQV